MADFSQAEYDALKSAYAKGVLTVEYADQKVTYRSMKEMRQLLKEMCEEIAPAKKWNGRTLAKFKSGL